MPKKTPDVFSDLDILISKIMNRYKNDELINIATAKLRSQKSTITYLKARVKNLVTKNKIK